jgi:hypothetical protein
LIALGIWFCIRKKKRNQRNREEHQRLEYEEQQHRHEPDAVPMEVDWDRIEEKYVELPQTNFGETNTSGSTTVVEDHRTTALPLVHPDGINVDRPHTYEHQYPQKPDGT